MSEREEKLEAIFQAAVELGSPDQQEVYLNRACAGEPELRRQVEELLKAAIGAEAAFEARGTVRVADSTTRTTPVLEQVGSLIGRYKLLERVGEGGCGVVYAAKQRPSGRTWPALAWADSVAPHHRPAPNTQTKMATAGSQPAAAGRPGRWPRLAMA